MAWRGAVGAVAALALVAALAACTQTLHSSVASPSPSASPARTVAAAPSPSPRPPAATRSSAGGVEALPLSAAVALFDRAAQSVIKTDASAQGPAFVKALISAGFPPSVIEVEASVTTIGLTPGSVMWSVKLHGDCVIGQYGPSSGGYHAVVEPPISTGRCLIGTVTSTP